MTTAVQHAGLHGILPAIFVRRCTMLSGRLGHIWFTQPMRLWEWMNAVGLAGIGASLLFMPTIAAVGGLGVAADLGAPVVFWGVTVLWVGVVRLVSLWFNGGWPRIGPIIRAAGAGVGALHWGHMGTILLLGGIAHGQYPIGVWTYVMLTCGELLSAARAMADVPRRGP